MKCWEDKKMIVLLLGMIKKIKKISDEECTK